VPGVTPTKEISTVAATTTPRILTAEGVIEALRSLRSRQPVKYSAFYSSQIGGIVTDPALMVIPFDDHMVHRGHGIFDTAAIVGGKIYDLEAHLDRFLRSAALSKLRLPASRDEMREIIVRTTATSSCRDGSIRYWMSSGPGSLELGPAAGADPGFFVMIFPGLAYPERWYTEGLKVMTTTYPIKPPLYAVTKSTNYLPNVLMQMEAKEAGFDNGVFIDADGHVGESSNMNVAFVTADGVFRHPRFDHILSGCTSLRLLELAPALRARNLITGVEVCDITEAAAHRAREMVLVGSSVKVAPVVVWDNQPIGDGRPGPVARALLELLEEDMRSGRDRLIDVPY
jgi:4-amino-4-deoxychorismate lyase